MFELLFEKFNKFYENIFFHYGLFISKYYKYTIIISFLINVLLSLGLFKIRLITDSDELFSVINSQAKIDEAALKKIFIDNKNFYEKNFYLHQLLDFGTWGEINFHVIDEISDKNIINEAYFDEIKHVHDLIVNNLTIKLKDVCAKRFNKCVIDGEDLLNKDFFEWLVTKSKNLETTPTDADSSSGFLEGDHIYANFQSFTDLRFILGKNFKFLTNNTTPAYATIFKLRFALKSNYVI